MRTTTVNNKMQTTDNILVKTGSFLMLLALSGWSMAMTNGHEKTAAQPANDNFWYELRNEFQLPEPPDNYRVRMHRKWYQRHPGYLDRVLTRAKPYLWYIRYELLSRGMPGEIALLPVVESAFDPYADSPGKAAGLWQIIPTTAKRFHLRHDSWYDGRRDVIDSTRAALDYLEILHRRFNGDWLLALAAYNSGEGTVSRAIRNNKKNNQPTDFWHLKLPRETRDYVPNLLALCRLVANIEAHDITLPEIPNRPYFDIVNTNGRINLARAAQLSGIPLDELHQLNAGFKKPSTPPSGPHRLLLPYEQSDKLVMALENTLDDATLYWVDHKVSEGETLGHLALHYNTSIRAIRQANKLSNNLIRVNKTLTIPAYDAPIPTQPIEITSLDDDSVEHIVKNGDTLWDLARHYKVSITELRRWNDLPRGRYLRPGQRLKLYLEGDTLPLSS